MSSVSDNYNLEGQNPLDVKIVSPNKSSLILKTQNDEFEFFRFYANMKIFFQHENEEWIWVEIIDKIQNTTKLLSQNYTYPGGTIAYGFDYSGKTFNFISYKDYLSLIMGINDGLTDGLISGLESEGVGVDVQNGLNQSNNRYKVSRLNSVNNSIRIAKMIDGSVSFSFEAKNAKETVEENSANIIKKFQDGILELFNISSSTLKVQYSDDNNKILIDYIATADETIKQFYVNENYNNPKADGTILKPFNNVLDAGIAVIGTGTALQPQFSNATIILQTGSYISQEMIDNPKYIKLKGRLTINLTTIISDNNSTISWGGNLVPFSTKFLKDESIAANNWNGKRAFSLKNIRCFSYTVSRIAELITYPDHTDNSATLYNFSAGSITNRDLYTELQLGDSTASNNWGDNFFGNKVYVESSIPVTDCVIYISGTNAETNLSNFYISGYLQVEFSNQTGIKLEKCTANLGQLKLVSNPLYRSVFTTATVQNRGVKSGLYGVEVINSWCYIQNGISFDGEIPKNGGIDSIINYVGDYSFPNSTVNISELLVYNTRCNSIFKLNQIARPTGITDPIFIHSISNISGNINLLSISKGSIFNEQNEVVLVGIDGSVFGGMKHQDISNILLSSQKISFVNGQPFLNLNYYENQTAVEAAGLLPGSLYYTSKIENGKSELYVKRVNFYNI